MSDRVARLDVAIPQNRFNFLAIVAHLESHGVHLEYPGTVVVKALTDLGDQFDRNRPWLLSMIGSAPVVRFQWWRNDSEDLYCRIRFIRGLCSIEFGLDGMDRGDEVRFLDQRQADAREGTA